ncbi:tRNA-dihydrouridine synthase family protein [Candidatus Woesearchaeota archaeon]|nr:tRNA-dihydrouridine synthase family protein [Candidatus Woesearchaeota archaeon]
MFPKLKNKFILAPMADVTILPFRLLCRHYGVSMAWTEQVNAMALVHESPKTIKMIETCKNDSPLAFQLSGNDAELIIKAAKTAKKLGMKYNVLDINMGCPSKKIVKLGYGSALLKEKTKIKEMMKKIVKEMNKIKIPVTVKMRSGFKKDEAVEIAKVLEESGVSAITIHARTQEQRYSGKADWSIIKKIKEAVKISVIGNGDVDSPEKAKQMLKETGCDYVMIGRAAIKNPAIFEHCVDFEKKGKYNQLTSKKRKEIFDNYIKLCKKHKCDDRNLKVFASSLIKGMHNGARARNSISQAKSDEGVIEIFNNFIKEARDE